MLCHKSDIFDHNQTKPPREIKFGRKMTDLIKNKWYTFE